MKIKANNGKIYELPENPVWRNGPPPSIGWWPASRFEDVEVLRWWNGGNWSFHCTPNCNEIEASHRTNLCAVQTQQMIKWTDRWWLFDASKAARKTDPATSKDAAKRAAQFAPTHQGKIMEVLRKGKASPEEIAQQIGIDAYQVRKRLPELERAGLICVTGETVPTISGRTQRVWRVL